MFWNENMGSVGGGGDRGLLVYGFGARDKGPEIGLCYGIMIQEIGLSKQCCSFKPKMRVNQQKIPNRIHNQKREKKVPDAHRKRATIGQLVYANFLFAIKFEIFLNFQTGISCFFTQQLIFLNFLLIRDNFWPSLCTECLKIIFSFH